MCLKGGEKINVKLYNCEKGERVEGGKFLTDSHTHTHKKRDKKGPNTFISGLT